MVSIAKQKANSFMFFAGTNPTPCSVLGPQRRPGRDIRSESEAAKRTSSVHRKGGEIDGETAKLDAIPIASAAQIACIFIQANPV
jgi:uncharacterized protein YcsI (UPF0317 family)